jgi:hypothetical protein
MPVPQIACGWLVNLVIDWGGGSKEPVFAPRLQGPPPLQLHSLDADTAVPSRHC